MFENIIQASIRERKGAAGLTSALAELQLEIYD